MEEKAKKLTKRIEAETRVQDLEKLTADLKGLFDGETDVRIIERAGSKLVFRSLCELRRTLYSSYRSFFLF